MKNPKGEEFKKALEKHKKPLQEGELGALYKCYLEASKKEQESEKPQKGMHN